MRHSKLQTALQRVRGNGHRRIDVSIFDEQNGSIEATSWGEAYRMNENVDCSSRMLFRELIEELSSRIVLSNIEWIESFDCRKFVFQLENARHEALLIAKKQVCSGFS